jgi:hypothetical protein
MVHRLLRQARDKIKDLRADVDILRRALTAENRDRSGRFFAKTWPSQFRRGTIDA